MIDGPHTVQLPEKVFFVKDNCPSKSPFTWGNCPGNTCSHRAAVPIGLTSGGTMIVKISYFSPGITLSVGLSVVLHNREPGMCPSKSASCETYNYCPSKAASCRAYNYCPSKSASCETYNYCPNKSASCRPYNYCRSKSASCRPYNYCPSKAASCGAYFAQVCRFHKELLSEQVSLVQVIYCPGKSASCGSYIVRVSQLRAGHLYSSSFTQGYCPSKSALYKSASFSFVEASVWNQLLVSVRHSTAVSLPLSLSLSLPCH